MKPVSVHVDLLNTGADKVQQKKTAAIAVFFACLVGILATVGAAASYRAASHGTSIFTEMRGLPVIAEFTQFASGEDAQASNGALAKTNDDRINILFLGVGGAGHDGAQLSDTIILASYDTKNEEFAMLSIPRDLAYPLGNSQFRKINNLNALYESQYPGEGAVKTAEAISELLVVRIDHVVRIDFDGFAKFIDALGGIDVNVERSFVDSSYPAPNHLWQTVRFEAGETHMDGDLALKFVRSRHGNNGEGSDFARSRRQQLVIQAARDKLLSLGTLANPKKISELFNIISGNLQTDLSAWDIISLVPLATKLEKDNITVRVLTDASDGELSPANVGGEYMLFPRKPDWSEIRSIAANPFISKEEEKQLLMPTTPISLEIKNGTNYEGYAYQVTQKLKGQGYTVPSFGNASHKGYERTMLYDLTGGEHAEELARLKKILDADISSATPQNVTDSDERTIVTDDMAQERIKSPSTEFLIILGESSLGLIQPYYDAQN